VSSLFQGFSRIFFFIFLSIYSSSYDFAFRYLLRQRFPPTSSVKIALTAAAGEIAAATAATATSGTLATKAAGKSTAGTTTTAIFSEDRIFPHFTGSKPHREQQQQQLSQQE
jgi:streptogramin lyase